ncbi:transcription factor jumonji [Nitzschia inconspicua]|uniref:Transcription factor jumonji n=1 Tax=Nitzschia inconspicua TaxID=303405 RepID=A0A9K3KSX3_9STRA|nr:transcription factor jumonji [Nitzschia inconspicua]
MPSSKRKANKKKEKSKKRLREDDSSLEVVLSREDPPPVVSRVMEVMTGGDNPPVELSLTPSLKEFFGGILSPQQFLTDFFRKQAVHTDCTDKHRKRRTQILRQEMFDLDYGEILSETSSDTIFVWLKVDKSNNGEAKTPNGRTGDKKKKKADSLIHSIEVSNSETALALLTAGQSTYCRAPPQVEQHLVASLLRETGLGCGQYDPTGESNLCLGRGEVETFISANGHVTDWHFDFQENFTIQLSGSKRWTLMEGTITDPLRGCTPHYNSPEAVESQLKSAYLYDKQFVFGQPKQGVNAKGSPKSVIMKPGDTLYFPAGMWHKVETLEPGVSINVSLMATNYAETISRAVYHYLYSDERFRRPIINNPVTSAISHLQELLKDLPTMLQQLCKPNGEGAHDILPPTLQFPPLFLSVEEDEEETNDGSDDDDDSVDDHSEDAVLVESAEESVDADNVPVGRLVDDGRNDVSPSEDESDEEEDFETLDPATFLAYPPNWDFALEMGCRVGLYKNPLSALHKLEEINSYYRKSSTTKKASSGVFVLNVNYAGNEAHESAIRVQFRDNKEGMVSRLWQLERNKQYIEDKKENGLLEVCEVKENNHYMISFLVYHGYIQIKPFPSSKTK